MISPSVVVSPSRKTITACTELAPFGVRAADDGQLLDEAGLLELGEHASDLTHGDPHFVVAVGQVIAAGSQDADSHGNADGNAGLLNSAQSGHFSM